MSTLYYEQAVEAVPAQAPGYSLLIAANTTGEAANDNPEVFATGAQWYPEQIGGGGIIAIGCPGVTEALGETTQVALTKADPFAVFAEDHCSTFGFKSRDYEGRGRRQLEATQSYEIAKEFQLGTIRDAANLNNYALTDGVVLHPGEVTPTQAVAELEAAIGETFKGRRAMIHMPVEAMTILGDGHLLSKAGQRWVTPMGTVVASDAGYGLDNDGYMYAYASAPVKIRLGQVFLNPGTFEEAKYSGAIDRDTNKVRIYAERAVLIQVDGGITTEAGSGDADAIFKVALNVQPWATHS